MTRASTHAFAVFLVFVLIVASQAGAALPQDRPFYATIKNSSSGTEQCLIFGGSGTDTHPSRYNWGTGAGAFCGFASRGELLANRQAVWLFLPLGNDLYTISNGPCGAERCLIFGSSGTDVFPSRYNWGTGHYCGFPGGKDELLRNGQAVFRVAQVDGDRYIISNDSGGAGERCVIFGGNGTEVYPHRYNWGSGPYCGFPGGREPFLDNRQGVFRIQEVGLRWPN